MFHAAQPRGHEVAGEAVVEVERAGARARSRRGCRTATGERTVAVRDEEIGELVEVGSVGGRRIQCRAGHGAGAEDVDPDGLARELRRHARARLRPHRDEGAPAQPGARDGARRPDRLLPDAGRALRRLGARDAGEMFEDRTPGLARQAGEPGPTRGASRRSPRSSSTRRTGCPPRRSRTTSSTCASGRRSTGGSRSRASCGGVGRRRRAAARPPARSRRRARMSGEPGAPPPDDTAPRTRTRRETERGRAHRTARGVGGAWRKLTSDQKLAAVAAVAAAALDAPALVPGDRQRARQQPPGVSIDNSKNAFQVYSFVEAAVFVVVGGVLALLFARGEPPRVPPAGRRRRRDHGRRAVGDVPRLLPPARQARTAGTRDRSTPRSASSGASSSRSCSARCWPTPGSASARPTPPSRSPTTSRPTRGPRHAAAARAGPVARRGRRRPDPRRRPAHEHDRPRPAPPAPRRPARGRRPSTATSRSTSRPSTARRRASAEPTGAAERRKSSARLRWGPGEPHRGSHAARPRARPG